MKNFSNYLRSSQLLTVWTVVLLLLVLSQAFATDKTPLPKQPLLFVENKGQITNMEGQTLNDIQFTTGNASVKLFISRKGIHYRFINPTDKNGSAIFYRLDMELVNANPDVQIRPEIQNAYTENFYNASFPEGILNVRSFGRIVYENIYPNIDWVLYSNEDGLKYDFIVRPGGNPNDIKIRYEGATQLEQTKGGAVLVTTPLGSVTEMAPVVFQGNGSHSIASSYTVTDNVIGFDLADYDREQVLVIDPILLWGNYIGGTELDVVRSVFADASNNMYAAGTTYSSTGISMSGHQSSFGGVNDGFIVKYNASGTKLWATYYGGSLSDDIFQIAGDGFGNVYVVGTTESTSGIASPGAYQTTLIGGATNAFIVKINSSGARQWGTYYGGTGGDTSGSALAVNYSGDVYVGGNTTATSGIVSAGSNGNETLAGPKAFVVALTSSGTRVWGRTTAVNQVTNDPTYITGISTYGLFVYVSQTRIGSKTSGSLIQLSASTGDAQWSKTLGNSFSSVNMNGVANDASGFVYVIGESSLAGLGTSGTQQPSMNSTRNGYMRKYDNEGTLIWGTYIGNSAGDQVNSISIDGFSIFLAGAADLAGFGTANTHKSNPSGRDAWVNKFNTSGIRQWGSYYGGSGSEEAIGVFAKSSYVLIGGTTLNSNTDISTTGTSVPGGGRDGFIARFSSTCPAVAQAGVISGSATVCQGSTQVFSVAAVANATSYQWRVPTNSTITSGQGTNSITVTIGSPTANLTVIVTARNTCDIGTAQTKSLAINPLPFMPSPIVGATSINTGSPYVYSVSSVSGVTYTWTAGSGGTVTGSGSAVIINWSTSGSKTVTVTATNGCGTSSARMHSVSASSCVAPVQPSFITLAAGSECANASSTYSVTNVAGVTYAWTVSGAGTITISGNTSTVVWNATTGTRTITVVPSNSCGNGPSRSLLVTVGSAPVQPSTITGLATICSGISTTYNVNNVSGVTYSWDTGGAGTVTGSGNSVIIIWNSAGAKTLTLTPSNSCGSGSIRALAVTVNAAPSQPSVIAGGNSVQTGSTSQYSVTPEAGVMYAWNGGTGATVTSSGSSVNISWSSAGSKVITVTPSNSCGNGTVRTLNVTVGDCSGPSQPSTVGGSTTACIGAGSTYLVTNVGGVSYNWEPGAGGTVVGSGNSVTLSWSTVGLKTIIVTPFNSCGNGSARTFAVSVSGVPAQSGTISGITMACKDATTAYSVANVLGVAYSWDTGGRGTVIGSGNSVNVTWTNVGSQTLVVTPSNACGNGAAQTLGVTVNKTPDPVSEIAGSFSACVSVATPFSVTNVSGVTYTWTGGANFSSSTTTSTSNISWTTSGSKVLTVTPSNGCGNGSSTTKLVAILATPLVPGSITGSITSTEGVASAYSVAYVSGTTYTWTAGTGSTIIGVGNSVAISWASIGARTVNVTATNLCATSTASTLGVTVGSAPCTPLGVPASLTGLSPVTTGSSNLYSVATVSGATAYVFTVAPSASVTINNTGNANEKNITFANAGTYVVSAAAQNACGANSAPATITVQACAASVAQPIGLTSTGAACIGKKQRYSVTVVDGFTYQWSATNGVITNVANGIADVTWNNITTGQVSVRSVNTCGFSSAFLFGSTETLINNPQFPTITNNLVGAFCDGKVVTWTISNPEVGVSYTWVSDRPATPTPTAITATVNGSINIGLFGTNACASNFNLGGITGNPFPVPTTAPGIISGSLSPETGQIVNYIIPNEGSPYGVSFDFGSGASTYPVGSTSLQAIFGTTGEKTLTVRYASNVSCNAFGPATTLKVVAVAPCSVPNPPTAVNRLHSGSICQDVGYAFSVPFIEGITYNWNAGAGATITGSGNEVLIKWSTNGTKDIIASYTNSCGTSPTNQTSIGITPPPASLAITGNSTACNGAVTAFSVSNVGGISFNWEASGTTLTGNGNNNILINNWPNTGVNVVKFKPSNACGFGSETSLSVTVSAVPAQPSVISGDAELCQNSSKVYSVTNEPGVTYAWDAGANSALTGSGNSRTISWSATGSKNLQVTPSNGCGSGLPRTLNPIVITVPAQPSVISGSATPTIGNSITYSVANTAGVSYTWSVSANGALTASGNSADVFWSGSGSATLSVTPTNSCGTGTVRTLAVTVSKIPQTITFTQSSPVVTTDNILLNGDATSGLQVSYTSSNISIAEVIGSSLLIKGNGTINITASQSGDATVAAAANVVRAVTINKTSQTITFDILPAQTFGNSSFPLESTATSGLAVSYASSNTAVATVSNGQVIIIGAGTTNITVTQGGDAIYSSATQVVRALTVNKADQAIEFESLVEKGISDPPFLLTATASSGLTVTYNSSNALVATVSGNTVTIVGQGSTTITASQAGNGNYNAASSVGRTLTINDKQSQTISFSSLATKTFGDANFNLSASASSGLAVSYSTTSNKITLSGSQVTLVSAGRASITASQIGNATFDAAPVVNQSFCINPTKPTVSEGQSGETVTLTSSNTSGNQWFKDGATISGATNVNFDVNTPGVYKVQVTIDDCVSQFSDDVAMVVTGDQASQQVEWKLFPNPAEDKLFITLPGNGTKHVQVIQADGRVLDKVTTDLNEVIVKVNQYAQGIYFVRIQNDKGIFSGRFFKK